MAVGVTNSSDRISVDSISVLEALREAAERLWAWFHFPSPFHTVKQSGDRRTLEGCVERRLLDGRDGAPDSGKASMANQQGLDGRRALQPARSGSEGLDRAFMRLQEEFARGRDVRLRISVQGKRQELAPVVEEQIHQIGREGVVNAWRHSGASLIEVEVEYTRRAVRVLVRDNGCGFDSTLVQSAWDSRSGLRSMHDRATSIGADLHIWTRPGAGTEVEISFPTSRAAVEGG